MKEKVNKSQIHQGSGEIDRPKEHTMTEIDWKLRLLMSLGFHFDFSFL